MPSESPQPPSVPSGAGAEPLRGQALPPTEVPARAVRRTFSSAYKLSVLKEADACRGAGEIGALLRREGLYSSHLAAWRKLRRFGSLAAGATTRRGPKGPSPEARESERLRKHVARLERKLAHAELLLDIQKKVSELLGIPLSPPPRDGSDS